ncbi:MAG: hypothetical protein CBB97_14805 [Candidatus Endolissoclinum sp. TMED37]|nr:MAG: hypothetical protein CBB97_14805 [Candidatus Endolissoclinum sp. TMED37]|tara:strand:+ start:1487 stop:1858 length:372 start_codon:yes stop_codon:yes gene_type:complete
MSQITTQGIIYNFLTGGILAILLVLFLKKFQDKGAAEVTGFAYGAPLLLPYFAFCVYFYEGANDLPGFAKHVLLGLVLTIPLLFSFVFAKKKEHQYSLLIFSIFYIIIICIVYLINMHKRLFK